MKCAVLKPGVYNLNRFRILIKEDEISARQHFVNEIKLTDDILLSVRDSSENFLVNRSSMADKPLISLD